MIVADFHVHSTFSVDGMSTMEQHCIGDSDFWYESVAMCRTFLGELSPELIVKKIIDLY
mgnify:CR=1 FL=1